MDQIKIGKFISELRKERNMTQREFAEVLGVSDKTISKWECGNGMPEVSIMPTLCSVLGITLNELFSGTRLSRDDYILKAEENIISLVQQAENVKNNIVGGQIIGSASDVDYCVDNIHCANTEFWDTIGSEFLGSTALPSYGGFTTEDRLGLLGNLHNKRTLEIGCGNGRSIKYVHDKGAKELWGIDISPKQLKRSKIFLSSQGIKAKLICVPMEKKGEIPNNYFDLVYSVFGIGWSTDLKKTFSLIHSYLKKDGKFVFSWSHPIHKCVYEQNGKYIFGNSYFDEKWYSANMGGKEIMLSNRKLSTYINTLSESGFKIEKIIEDSDENLLKSENSEFSIKARKMPVLFVIKASKI